MYIPYVHKVFI